MREFVFILEQQALLRDALVALLSPACAPGAVRGVQDLDGLAAMEGAADGAGCVVLVDTTIEGGIGAVRQRLPAAAIVALDPVETRDGILQCLAAGAHGYVAKSAPASSLLAAVRTVRGGGVHVPAALASPAAVEPGPMRVGQLDERLTGRQRDVLLLMAEGRSTKDIARTLDLAVSTIKVHLAGVYRAVGARNRVEALCRAGLLPRQTVTG